MELLDVVVPEHGGGQLGVERGVGLAAAQQQVLGVHCNQLGSALYTFQDSQ